MRPCREHFVRVVNKEASLLRDGYEHWRREGTVSIVLSVGEAWRHLGLSEKGVCAHVCMSV